jgi:hypothetical protein
VKADAIVEVRFKTTAEGGRQTDISHDSGEFRCPLFVGDESFDCRVHYEGILRLGSVYELPVRFLSPELVLPKLSRGCRIRLWEGKDIATGVVLSLLAPK